MFESTPRRMIRREGGSSRGRMPMGVRPRDNGRMTLSTVERPALGDWHVDGVRVWWDRIRAWDESHERWSDLGISVLLLVVCLAFPRGFGVHRLDSAIFQVALIVPLIWRRREPTVVFLAIAAVAFGFCSTHCPLYLGCLRHDEPGAPRGGGSHGRSGHGVRSLGTGRRPHEVTGFPNRTGHCCALRWAGVAHLA
jgi:hypothetical protein